MSRVICKCGQQFRTLAKSGTQVQCPRCANEMTVTEKIFDLQDRIRGPHSLAVNPDADRFGEGVSAGGPPRHEEPKRLRFLRALGFAAVGLAAAIILTVLFWNGKNESTQALIQDQSNRRSAKSQEQPSATSDFRWSSVANWDKDFLKHPKGQQIQAYSEQIAQAGQSMDPFRFWQKLDTEAFKNRVFSPVGSLIAYQEKLSIEKIFDKLKGIPIDAVSNPFNTTGSNWKVIGIHQGPNLPGVLVRYFHDPLKLVELVQSEPWIESLRQMISFAEYANVARDLFASSPSDTPSRLDKSELDPNDSTVHQTIFTPMFGYMVLLFKVEQETQDPVLLDIQSRIYWSNNRKEEASKLLDLAEKSGSLSAYYFQRNIEGSIDQNDKPSSVSPA